MDWYGKNLEIHNKLENYGKGRPKLLERRSEEFFRKLR